jgi:hypothetical protein
LGAVFRELAQQKESTIIEGHMSPDHVHMLVSIPPKYSVSQVVGYIKGKSAIYIARIFCGRKKNFVGQSFWPKLIDLNTLPPHFFLHNLLFLFTIPSIQVVIKLHPTGGGNHGQEKVQERACCGQS